ncbi:hypothetical protein [Demequina sp.]|uniref:hypothetical protein n=1 Tax=Demequina sp. TaxID=2050685 RepID=UPI003D0B7E31
MNRDNARNLILASLKDARTFGLNSSSPVHAFGFRVATAVHSSDIDKPELTGATLRELASASGESRAEEHKEEGSWLAVAMASQKQLPRTMYARAAVHPAELRAQDVSTSVSTILRLHPMLVSDLDTATKESPGVGVSTHLMDGGPSEWLKTVVEEVLGNAHLHGARGLVAGTAPEAAILVRARVGTVGAEDAPPRAALCITIADTGQGIALRHKLRDEMRATPATVGAGFVSFDEELQHLRAALGLRLAGRDNPSPYRRGMPLIAVGLSQLEAQIEIRTGRVLLTRNFASDPLEPEELGNPRWTRDLPLFGPTSVTGVPPERALVRGTSIGITVPLERNESQTQS